MPQTAAGSSILKKFAEEYGKKGKGYFFGKVVKDRKFAKTTGEMSVHNRAKK